MTGLFGRPRLAAALLSSCVLVSTPAFAAARPFDIPAQSLSSALTVWARQANVQVFFPSDAIRSHRSPALKGDMSRQEALSRLIAGSSLRVVSDNGRTVVLGRRTAEPEPANSPSAGAGERKRPASANYQDERSPNVDARSDDTIVVTGIRESLDQGIAIKRQSSGVTDVIVADDIAQFPDENMAEALQRVTGVTIDRDSGEGTEVLIRGLDSKFTATMINGMQAATSAGGRQFDFTILASELFRDARISKTSSADTVEGGIGGTVDLHTPSPFAFKKRTLNITGLAGYNTLNQKWSPKVAGLYADQFMDGRLRVVASVAYSDRQRRQDAADTTEWNKQDIKLKDGRTFDDVYLLWNPRSLSDVRHYKRLGVTGAIGFEINNDWRVSLNAIRSHEDTTYNRYTYQWYVKQAVASKPVGTLTDVVIGGENGKTVVYAYVKGGYMRSTIDDQVYNTDFGLYNFDVNGRIGNWKIFGRAGYTDAKTDYSVKNLIIYNSVADFSYDIRDNPKVFKPWTSLTSLLDPKSWTLNSAEVDAQTDSADEYMGQLDISGELGWGPLQGLAFGGRWSDRSTARTIYSIAPTLGDAAAKGLLAPTYFDNFLSGLPGLPEGYPRQWLGLDNAAERDAFGVAADVPRGQDNATFLSSDYRNNYTLGETTKAGYLIGNVDFNGVGLPLKGDIGVRVVDTTVSGQGFQKAAGNAIIPYSFSNSNTQVLPSMNLRLDPSDKLVFRLSASRTMTRPDLVDLAPNGRKNPANFTIDEGNPGLAPFTAKSVDLSAEWYFAPESLLSAALFYKNVKGFIIDETVSREEDGDTYEVTRPINSAETYNVKGAEISFQMPWKWAPGLLSHFGHILNYTYVTSDTNEEGSPGFEHGMPGLSHHSYNAILYYQDKRFRARAAFNYRSKYYRSSNRDLPIYEDAYSQLDLSASYRISRNIDVRAQLINALNSTEYQYIVDPGMTERYGVIGRTVYLGMTVRL